MPRPRRAAALPPLWDEPSRPRAPLTRADLAQAGLALLDQAGFDGLTMRALAERLGVQAASLYNHIRDKRDVLALVADAIAGEVPSPDLSRPWRAELEATAQAYRRVLRSHRDAARVLTATPPVGPHRLRLIDEVLGLLRAAGLSDEAAADASWVFNTYVTGFVLDETQMVPSGEASGQALAEARAQVAAWFRSLPAERFPNVVALAEPMVDGQVDRRFAFGLTALLDGLEARLARQPAG